MSNDPRGKDTAPIPLGGSTTPIVDAPSDLPAPARQETPTNSGTSIGNFVPNLMDDLPMRAPAAQQARTITEKPNNPVNAPDPSQFWGEFGQKTGKDWQKPEEVTERDAAKLARAQTKKNPLAEHRTRKVITGLITVGAIGIGVLLIAGLFMMRPWADDTTPAPANAPTTTSTKTPDKMPTEAIAQPATPSTPTSIPSAKVPRSTDPPTINPTPANAAPLLLANVPLTDDNVDTLSCVVLRNAADVYDKLHPVVTTAGDATAAAQQRILLWAWYRLAVTCGDHEAQQQLLRYAPNVIAASITDPHYVAAVAGAWLIAGKLPYAEKLLNRWAPENKKRKRAIPIDPHVAMVWAQIQQRKGATSVAAEVLRSIATTQPQWRDAQMAWAAVQLQSEHTRNGALATLNHLTKQAIEPGIALHDPSSHTVDGDMLTRIAQLYLAAQQPQRVDAIIAALPEHYTPMLATIAPLRRDDAMALRQARALRSGDVIAARNIANQRTELFPDHVEGYRDVARLALYAGEDPAPVFVRARAALQDPAALAQLAYEQVRLALYRGDVLGAREAQHTFPQSGSTVVAAWTALAEAHIAYMQDHIPQAISAYASAAKKQPSAIGARTGLIQCTVRGVADRRNQLMALIDLQTQKQRNAWTGAPAINSDTQGFLHDYAPWMALITSHELAGTFSPAATLLDQVLWQDTTLDDPVALLQRWLGLRARTGDRERAVQDAQAAMLLIPNPEHAAALLIHVTRAAGQPQQALTMYDALLKQYPADARYAVGLAMAAMDAGQPQLASDTLDAFLRKNPQQADDPHLLYALGRSVMGREPLKARTQLEHANDRQPRADIFVALAELKLQRDQWDDALALYDKALVRDPRLYGVQLQSAKMAVRRGQTDEAIKRLGQIPPTASVYDEATELRGDLLRDHQRPEEAIQAYEGSLRITGDHVRILLKIAALQIDVLNQLKPAVDTLQRAIKADPQDGEAHRLLGYALRDLGQDRAAQAQFRAYLKLAPEGPYADEVKTDLRDMGRLH